jgi:ABC-2 type transport system permease protein
VVILFIIPALAMKSFAEEQQNGTLQWLFSQPKNLRNFREIFICIFGRDFMFIAIIGLPLFSLCFGRTRR